MIRTALLCCLLPLPLAAQTTPEKPPAPPPPAPSKSGMTVSVPLLIRDKKGAPVANPTKDELTLNEDSSAQNILTLVPAAGQPLVFGILVDTSRGQRGATAEEKAASIEFINAMMKSAQDRGFVVHFDSEVELLQDLTASKEKVQQGASLLGSAGGWFWRWGGWGAVTGYCCAGMLGVLALGVVLGRSSPQAKPS